MEIMSTPGVPKVISDKLCAVYDDASGEVLHLHRVTTLEGGHPPNDAEVEATALAHARLHAGIRKVGALIVDPTSHQSGARHKIDRAARRLIPHFSK